MKGVVEPDAIQHDAFCAFDCQFGEPGGVGRIGGSQREERLDVLDARMIESGLDPAHYSWYRDLRRYGSVPHAGFGLGFERTISYVTGLGNVRDVIPFPRTPGNAKY